jgi:hypothetical protein
MNARPAFLLLIFTYTRKKEIPNYHSVRPPQSPSQSFLIFRADGWSDLAVVIQLPYCQSKAKPLLVKRIFTPLTLVIHIRKQHSQ